MQPQLTAVTLLRADIASKRALHSTIHLLLGRLLHCAATSAPQLPLRGEAPSGANSAASCVAMTASRNSGALQEPDLRVVFASVAMPMPLLWHVDR